MAQPRNWLLMLILEMYEVWELTNLVLPFGLAHTFGHTQLYISIRVVSRVVVRAATMSVIQHARLRLEEMAAGEGAI